MKTIGFHPFLIGTEKIKIQIISGHIRMIPFLLIKVIDGYILT